MVCCGHNNTFQAETCSRGRYCWCMFPQGYAGPAERHNCTINNVDLSSLSSWEFQGGMCNVGLMSPLSCGWIRRHTHARTSFHLTVWEQCLQKRRKNPLRCWLDRSCIVSLTQFTLLLSTLSRWSFIGLSPGSVRDSYPEDNEAHAQPHVGLCDVSIAIRQMNWEPFSQSDPPSVNAANPENEAH